MNLPSPMLVIVADRWIARDMGANQDNGRLRTHPAVRFWWPEYGTERIKGCRFEYVIDLIGLSEPLRSTIKAIATRHDTVWINGVAGYAAVEGTPA